MEFLTSEQICYVLQDCKPIPNIEKDISENVCKRIKKELKKNLKECRIYPSMIDDLKKKITFQYYDSQIHPGESIGVLTAQSIGERQTQLSLDSFHSAGITSATVVTGVPRFNELMNTSKNPKNVLSTIFLTEEYKNIQDIRENAGIRIQHVTFNDILVDSKVYERKDATDYWYEPFKMMYNVELGESYTHFIRCLCNLETLFAFKLSLEDICSHITDIYDDLECVWSPNIVGIIDIWINTANITSGDSIYINEDNKITIYSEDVVIPNLSHITINGIEGIEKVLYTERDGEWIIEAMGFNLKKLLANDMIDSTRTMSNNMWELYDTLGVEATREFLIQEFINIISVDSYINIRHIQSIVDCMLYRGSISSISRYGVHQNESGALSKCSFEETLEQFLKAGLYGERERINGVSGAIICGKVSNAGTGLCELVYNNII
jgi:DNA-directed RNA polymerase beta' subunit